MISRRAGPLSALFSVLGLALASCGDTHDVGTSDTVQWLRTAGNFDETPVEIACMHAAMNDLLSTDELDEWLAQDPENITIDEIQALDHAIDVADRCR